MTGLSFLTACLKLFYPASLFQCISAISFNLVPPTDPPHFVILQLLSSFHHVSTSSVGNCRPPPESRHSPTYTFTQEPLHLFSGKKSTPEPNQQNQASDNRETRSAVNSLHRKWYERRPEKPQARSSFRK